MTFSTSFHAQILVNPTYDYPHRAKDDYCQGFPELNPELFVIHSDEDSLYFKVPMRLEEYLNELPEDEIYDLDYYLLDEQKMYYFNQLSQAKKRFYPIYRIEDKIFFQSFKPPFQRLRVVEYGEVMDVINSYSIHSKLRFLKIYATPQVEELVLEYNGAKRILCERNITPIVINRIGNMLKKEGYMRDYKDYRFDEEFKEALYKFQWDNNLPIGYINSDILKQCKFSNKQVRKLIGAYSITKWEYPDFIDWDEEKFLEWWNKVYSNRIKKFSRRH